MKLFKTITNELSQKQVFWVLLTVVVAVFPHLPRLPIWFPFFMIFVVAIRWSNAIKKIEPLPSWLVMLLTITLFISIIYFYGVSLNRELSVTVLTIMTVLKLLETWRKRDAWMVVTLSYFVILTRFFYSQDFILLFYLLASILITTHALFVLQHDNGSGLFKKEFKQTTNLLFAGIPLAILLFFFFPRLGSPIWGSPDMFGKGKTGISEEMSPGSISELFEDDSTAFRVTFSGDVPSNNKLYWRGPVLWDFDGKTWRRNKQLKTASRSYRFAEEGEYISYEVELEPTGSKYLFALDAVNSIETKARILSDSQVVRGVRINQLMHYSASSVLKDYNAFEQLSLEMLDRLKELPKGFNPRTVALIKEWKESTNNEQELISKILKLFTEDEFFYTFTPEPLSGNTVDQFLFETKNGFCEHYASAFTFMMRAAGIPARVVTGYQGAVKNGDYYLIKQSDAHAWSEVWIKDKGWLRVDPTAAVSPLRVEQGSQALISQNSRNWYDKQWLRSWRDNYDKVRHKWNQFVRDFNINKQKALFNRIGFDSQDGKSIAIVLAVITLISTLFVVVYLYLMRPRKHRTELEKIYQKYVTVFANKGIKKHSSQGVLEYASEVTDKFQPVKLTVIEFNELYLKLRYGKANTENILMKKRLLKLINKIKKEL